MIIAMILAHRNNYPVYYVIFLGYNYYYFINQDAKTQLSYLAHKVAEVDKYRYESCGVIGELALLFFYFPVESLTQGK